METWSHVNSDKSSNSKVEPFSYILQKNALEYLDSNQNDSSRSEKLMKQ